MVVGEAGEAGAGVGQDVIGDGDEGVEGGAWHNMCGLSLLSLLLITYLVFISIINN